MGRWVVFLIWMFSICTYATAAASGGGGIAVTYLTAPMTAASTSMSVANNKDFLQSASATRKAYLQIDDEIVCYTANPPNSISFTSVLRGQADPGLAGAPISTAVAHIPSATRPIKVRTLQVALIDSFMGTQITTSTASFGPLDVPVLLWKMFAAVPKLISWDYPALQEGPAIYIKYFILYALSAGFVVSLCFAAIVVASGFWK